MMNREGYHILLATFLSLLPFLGIGQDQSVADSLIEVADRFPRQDTARLKILTLIANNQTDPRKKLKFADLLMEEAREIQDLKFLHHAYLNQGQAYRLMGDFDVAIYSLFKALDYAEKSGYIKGEAGANTALADVYSILGNHNNSLLYYKEALGQLTSQDSVLLATILLNMGDEYYMSNMYDSALVCFQESKRIYERMGGDRSGLAYNLGNIGLVQAQQGDLEQAERNVRASIRELEKLEDHYGSAIFLTYMAEIYQRKGLLRDAKEFADSSMSISRRYGLKAEIRDNSLRLADIYAMSADYESAYRYHQEYVALKDSISNDEIYNRIENLEGAFELAKKQAEVDLLKAEQKNQQIIITTATLIAVILTILAYVSFRYYRSKARINVVLEEQKRVLETLNETKDKFFSIISHDLRGPINSFHGISSLIKYFVASREPDQLLEVADDIDKSVDQLSTLLDNLLSWAMKQQGQFSYAPESLNLKEMTEELVATLGNMARGKGIALSADIDPDISLWADRNTTMTILRNLVNNALKFTPRGGKVELTARVKDRLVEIRVQDTGVGMAQEKVENIFMLEDDKSTYGTAGEKGLGLGLQLVHEFIEVNNGRIYVQSQENVGTEFVVELPASVQTESVMV